MNIVPLTPIISDPELCNLNYLQGILLSPEVAPDAETKAIAIKVYSAITKDLQTKPRTVFGTNMSCGVSYLSGLAQDSKVIVSKVLEERHIADKNIREAFVIFSDVADTYADNLVLRRKVGGDALCRYIRENNLGDIVDLPARTNPNSGNKIKVWLWAPPHKSLGKSDRHMPIDGLDLSFNQYGDAIYKPKLYPKVSTKPFDEPNGAFANFLRGDST